MLESKLLCSGKKDDSRIELFASKAFLSILRSDRIWSLCLMQKLAKAVTIADVTKEEIDSSKVGSMLCNILAVCAIMLLKWAVACTKALGSIS